MLAERSVYTARYDRLRHRGARLRSGIDYNIKRSFRATVTR